MWLPISRRALALWQYRAFVFNMVGREFRVRYLGSLFGSIWSIVNPMAMIFIYTVIFSKIMHARLAGVNDTLAYGLFLCAGLTTWGFFAELLSRCQNIFIEQANMLKKIRFPRITLPTTLFLTTALNFSIIFSIFLVFLLITGRFPGWSIFGFIPLLLIQQGIALGFGLFFGTLNVFFRDIGHLIGIVLQFWFWLTPIVYPISILPERIKSIIELNPMTKIILAYQEIVLQSKWPIWSEFYYHALVAVIAMAAGSLTFIKLSGDIVDEL
ncbi:ABC transporter permease [Candidatus Parcubacteria bacterium]|nr:MAG: ABC transporter permease [Candidatus Parcubacteria bacterium]